MGKEAEESKKKRQPSTFLVASSATASAGFTDSCNKRNRVVFFRSCEKQRRSAQGTGLSGILS
jgi:hypothetical protein